MKGVTKILVFCSLWALPASLARAEIEPIFLGEGGIGYRITAEDLTLESGAQGRGGIHHDGSAINVSRHEQYRPYCIAATPQIPIHHDQGMAIIVPQFESEWMGTLNSEESQDIITFSTEITLGDRDPEWFVVTTQDYRLRWVADHGGRENFYMGQIDQRNIDIHNIEPQASSERVMFVANVQGNEPLTLRYCFVSEGTQMTITGLTVVTFPFQK